MKKNIKNNSTILFSDINTKKKFIIKSLIKKNDCLIMNNRNFKLKKINISSESHQLYNNKNKKIEDKIKKFKKKYLKKTN